MGWWKIDPETGRPHDDSVARRQRGGLINAVPGMDDATDHFLGDTNWDYSSTLARELTELLVGREGLRDEGLRDLLLLGCAPAAWPVEVAARVFAAVDLFWSDLDAAYHDDWGRAATGAERRWTVEDVVETYNARMTPPRDDEVPKNPIKLTILPAATTVRAFAVGDRVWAWWNSPQDLYYVGTVVKIGGVACGTDGRETAVDYLVKFDDGDTGPVPPGAIVPLAAPVGLPVNYRPPGSQYYFPAVVVAAGKGTVRVRTEDGRELTVPYAAVSVRARELK